MHAKTFHLIKVIEVRFWGDILIYEPTLGGDSVE